MGYVFLKRVAAGIIGALIGGLCSILVNSTLIEVSINAVFSIVTHYLIY